MKRLVIAEILCLAACGSATAPGDMTTGNSGDDLTAMAMSDLSYSPDSSIAMAPPDLSVLPDLTRPLVVDMAMDVYPAGPYGSNVGDTIAPLVWEGYINPTAKGIATKAPYGPLAMNDLRKSGNKFAALYAADWF